MNVSGLRFLTVAKFAAIPVGLVVGTAVVWQASYSAFSGTTSNPTNNWSTGTVVLADDDSSTAMFTATGLKPGATASKCIVVAYSGTLASTVTLYGTGETATNSFDTYIDLVIEQGTGGTFASCAGFSVDAGAPNTFTGTLAAFGAAHTNFGNGFGTFAPASAANKVYKVTYTVNAATPNSAQGGTAAMGLTWEAQNS
jgi:hypothetical protein